MIRILISALLFLLTSLGFAQNTIIATIQNKENKTIDFAEVYLLDEQDSLIQSTFTNESGGFNFKEVASGNYKLQIHYFAKLALEQSINVQNNTDLGILKIDNSSQLDEIVLEARAKLIERQVDRLVFNVENSVTALGGDALDALKNTPQLNISNESINIAGKSSVQVMINDRIIQMSGEDLMNYLKSIPASNIKKIEVITNPPAKYEASGNSGLINIVLKEAKQDAWSSTLRSSYRQATYGTFNNGVNFSYDKNKLSALVDIYQYDGKNIYTNDINYLYPTEDWQENMHNKNSYKGFGGLLTLNYKINDKNSIGLQYNGGDNDSKSDEKNQTHSYSNQELIKEYFTKSDSKGENQYHSLNLNFDHKFDTIGKKVTVDLDYWANKGKEQSPFLSDMNNIAQQQHSITKAINDSDRDIDNISGKVDFYMPYKFGTLEYGAKASSTNTNYNVFSEFKDVSNNQITLSQKDEFKYKESIQAVYASYSVDFSKKWMGKVGLRGEYTQTESNSVKNNQVDKNDYFKIFPTVYIQYKPNDNHSFNANFGRRIQRPGYWEMNPNRWYNNATSYGEGNPFLQPAFVYNFELNYSYSDYLHVKAYYQNMQDGYGQITVHDVENQTQIFKRLNYYKANYLGLVISSTIKPFTWLESNNEFGITYNESKNNTDLLAPSFSGSSSYFKSYNSLTFSADKTFLGEVNFRYSFASKVREYRSTPEYYVDLGFKYLAFDKKLTIGLAFEDIFNRDFNTMRSEIQGVKQSFTQYYDTQLVRLSLSYRFGNSKINVSQRQTSNQEESGRGGS